MRADDPSVHRFIPKTGAEIAAERVAQHAIGGLAGQEILERIRRFEDASIAFDQLLLLVDN